MDSESIIFSKNTALVKELATKQVYKTVEQLLQNNQRKALLALLPFIHSPHLYGTLSRIHKRDYTILKDYTLMRERTAYVLDSILDIAILEGNLPFITYLLNEGALPTYVQDDCFLVYSFVYQYIKHRFVEFCLKVKTRKDEYYKCLKRYIPVMSVNFIKKCITDAIAKDNWLLVECLATTHELHMYVLHIAIYYRRQKRVKLLCSEGTFVMYDDECLICCTNAKKWLECKTCKHVICTTCVSRYKQKLCPFCKTRRKIRTSLVIY